MNFREGKVLKKERIGGVEVIFRLPKRVDVRGLREYINSLVEEKARITMVKKVTLMQEKKWLEGRIKGIKEGKYLMVCIEVGGKVVGSGFLFRRNDPPSAMDHVAEIGFGISKNFRRMGITGQLVKLLIGLGEKEWGIEVVRSNYVSDNVASARIHKKLGFRKVGIIPRGTKYGKRYLDEVLVVRKA